VGLKQHCALGARQFAGLFQEIAEEVSALHLIVSLRLAT